MIFYIESLGCARNGIDSDVMAGRLEASGHRFTEDPALAEVIVVNTCGFIEPACDESVDTILEMAGYKTHGRAKRLIVTGCLAERYKDGDLVGSLPEVDAFAGTGAGDRIVGIVESDAGEPAGEPVALFPDPAKRAFQGHPLPRRSFRNAPGTACLKVSEGCSRKCTYCIIPKLRGRQRSRPLADIAQEAETLAAAGARELILTAENTTDYGADLDDSTGLSHVLQAVSARAPDVWIRLLYAHPASFSDAVIHTISETPSICPYFDIPVQHAAPGILKRMGRPGSTDDLYALFDRIRRKDPSAALRTTILTGFPGETDADFNALMTFIETVKFDHLGVFVYSDAADLKSHTFDNHVPADLAQERHDRIMEKQARISYDINRKHVGKQYRVLVEEMPEEGLYLGRTRFQAPEVDGVTFIYAAALEIGSFVDVKITEAYEYDIAGNAA